VEDEIATQDAVRGAGGGHDEGPLLVAPGDRARREVEQPERRPGEAGDAGVRAAQAPPARHEAERVVLEAVEEKERLRPPHAAPVQRLGLERSREVVRGVAHRGLEVHAGPVPGVHLAQPEAARLRRGRVLGRGVAPGVVSGLRRQLAGAVQELHLRPQLVRRLGSQEGSRDESRETGAGLDRDVPGGGDAGSAREERLEGRGDVEAEGRDETGAGDHRRGGVDRAHQASSSAKASPPRSTRNARRARAPPSRSSSGTTFASNSTTAARLPATWLVAR
jgi:hypothetical protein